MHTSPERSSWHILCLGNHACKWLSGRCVRCAFAQCLHSAILMANASTLCNAAIPLCQESPFSVLSQTCLGGGSSLFSSPFPCFKDFPAPCVPKCSRHPSATSDAEHHPCFVTSGAAHNNRSTAGTPSALHQQHLTPAQQATQAAITAPATHQDGKVPVRTGLAWAALGTPYPPASHVCWR